MQTQMIVASDFYGNAPQRKLVVAATVQARNALYRAGQEAFRNGAAPQDMATEEERRGYMKALRDSAYAETSAYLVKTGAAQ